MTPIVKKVALGIAGLAAAAMLACGALLVYLRFFWNPEFPVLDRLIAAAELLGPAELIAVVPERDEPILVFRPAADSEALYVPDRRSLSVEICKLPPEANVVVLLRHRDADFRLPEFELTAVSSPPFVISCPTSTRFFSVERRPPSTATQ